MYVMFTLMILDFFLFHTHLEAVVSVNSLDLLPSFSLCTITFLYS